MLLSNILFLIVIFFVFNRFAKKRLSHIEKALAMAPKDSNSMTSAAKREIVSIKKEQENKVFYFFYNF